MSGVQILFLVLVFVAVLVVALVILLQLGPRQLQSRLKQLERSEVSDTLTQSGKVSESKWTSRVVKLAEPFSRLSLPKEGWENSPLRVRFMHAGYNFSSAPELFFAAKTLLALILPFLAVLYLVVSDAEPGGNLILILALLSSALGYFMPNVFLERRISHRQREIFESIPDALDLTTVCVEAGLGLDAALARVGEEIRFRSPLLGDEFHLVNLELRAGGTRERALRNLAHRTGVEEIETLVALLVQSDRFGTSVAESLRVHSETMRSKRKLLAEEAAAKIPLKLLFPLIFFVFPSLLVVLLGPAFISIYRTLLPTLGAG
ncbi:MAG: type II secretion system F family protein [Gallionella sp.]|nr:type II secretion system F family protein [Gallionella sp.]